MKFEPPFLRWDRRRAKRLLLQPRRPRWLLGRRVLLALAAAILVACAISHPFQFLFTLWGRLVGLVIGGFVIAAAVHGLATIFFRAKAPRWHTRSAALVFLFVALVAINAVLRLADRFASAVFGTEPFVSSATVGYVLLAFELVWTVVLDGIL